MARRVPLRRQLGTYLVLVLFALFAVYPVTQIVTVSLRPGDQLLSRSLALIPDGATFQNYVTLLTETPFLRWLGNSLLVSAAVTLTGVILASGAAYVLSRYRFRGHGVVLQGLLVTQMFPATMLLLPLFFVLIRFQLLNTYAGLVVIYTATALPFCIWQLKGYYDTIPFDLEEAACIDGCTATQAFVRIILPLAAPGLAVTALFSFMAAWNEYVVAALVLQEVDLFTLPLGLKSFQNNLNTEWGLYAAGALLVSVPVVLLFLYLTRFLVGGLTAGGVKE